jgi:murein DD-endopeptidase MepM/ murein hydrolase activator NlpD
MGAAGLLVPQQGDEAMAIEPVAAEPNSPTLPAAPSTSVSPSPAKEAQVVAVSTPQTPEEPQAAQGEPTAHPMIEHKVQEGETLWALSKTYEVHPEAIAASNNIQPSAVLPVGQKLKIPSVNGIVHEVQAGETVETLSKSYGVEPTQLQAFASVSEASQLKKGETVTVPGNVNNLLKARQDVALKNLKEQRNRLNDSLAELRSEESINLSNEATVPTEADEAHEPVTPVTLPPVVLNPQESVANVPQVVASASASPVVIPVPTPELAATPRLEPKVAPLQSPVAIPVPTPEIAATPRLEPRAAARQSPVSRPVPTPEIAATPRFEPNVAPSQSPVAIPVPTPEIAATPRFEPKAVTVPNLTPDVDTTTAAKPQVPRPVVMQPLEAVTTANLYKVKPGDTLEAIARQHGVSRSELIRVNGLNNPNILGINQPLKIPQAQSANAVNQTVTLLPGIDSKASRSTSGQEQPGVVVPTLAVSTVQDRVTPRVPTPLSQPQSLPRPILAQSTVVADAKPNSPVVVNTQSSQSTNSDSNPYIEKLRADINKLREGYHSGIDSSQASAPINISVPTVPAPVTSTSSANNSSIPARVNPEFKPDQRNESMQAGLARRRQLPQAQQGSIKIEVPPPEAPDLVASAQAPAGGYNPALRAPVGQTVSPELPSLSAPDMYLPGSSNRFNGYIWPTKGVLTSGYGWRWGRMHKGIDIAAPVGTPVVAAAPGIVVTAGWNSGGYGNLVEIQHPDGSLTLYAHNNRILVRQGQEVAQGQQISEMGSTGRSTGPHCHFEMHPNGRGAVNPIAYLPRK